MPPGGEPAGPRSAAAVSVRATALPPPLCSSTASASTYLTSTRSPTLSLSKLTTSGPATAVNSCPFSPTSVSSRVAASIALIVACAVMVCAIATLPGLLDSMTLGGLGCGRDREATRGRVLQR